MACHVILGTISIHLLLTVKSLKSVKEMWDAVKKDFMIKSKMHQVDTRCRLQQSKCDEAGDVKAHLIKMVMLCNELAWMGTSIDEVMRKNSQPSFLDHCQPHTIPYFCISSLDSLAS
jgi:hypothetical protein